MSKQMLHSKLDSTFSRASWATFFSAIVQDSSCGVSLNGLNHFVLYWARCLLLFTLCCSIYPCTFCTVVKNVITATDPPPHAISSSNVRVMTKYRIASCFFRFCESVSIMTICFRTLSLLLFDRLFVKFAYFSH